MATDNNKRLGDKKLPDSNKISEVFNYTVPKNWPKNLIELTEIIDRIGLIEKQKTFVPIDNVSVEDFLLRYFFPEEEADQIELFFTANIPEINNELNSATQRLIREIIKQFIKKGADFKPNLNVLVNNFYRNSKGFSQLIGVALDENDCPCLINSREINASIPINEISAEIKIGFIRNHIAGIFSLNISHQIFLGIQEKIEEIETILAKIK